MVLFSNNAICTLAPVSCACEVRSKLDYDFFVFYEIFNKHL